MIFFEHELARMDTNGFFGKSPMRQAGRQLPRAVEAQIGYAELTVRVIAETTEKKFV